MNRALRNWIIVCLALVQHLAVAQRYTFLSYGAREGLPHSQLRCLHQDARGFIWIGSLGGLSRFDGKTFTNYDEEDGLPDNQVNCIVSFSDTVVAGNIGGFSVLTGGKIRGVQLPHGFLGAAVNSIYRDGGTWWIGTDRGILFWNGKKFEHPVSDDDPWKLNVKTIVKGADNRLLVVTKDAAFWVTTSNQHVELAYKPNDPEGALFDALELGTASGNFQSNSIILATKGSGFVTLNPAPAESGLALGLDVTTITALAAGANDEVWMASRFGFFRYDGRDIQSFDENNGLPNTDIRDLLVDREGCLWLATNGGGLLRFTGRAFSAYTTEDGLSSNAVMSISRDRGGDFWFSTHDNGICRLSHDTIIKYDLSEFSSNNRTWTSVCDLDGNMWFGTSDGLYRYREGKWSHFTESDSLSDNLVINLFVSRDSTLWIGTANGLCTIRHEIITPLEASPKTRIRGITEDRTGVIWLATLDGLYRYDDGVFTVFTESEGLPDNSTQCVEADNFNRIWVGTKNGLALLSGTRFVSFYPGPASQDRSVNFLKYLDHSLWIGTNNGLYRMDITDETSASAPQFFHFSEEDGLRSLELNLNAVYGSDDGHLWFGTTEGVMSYDLSLAPDEGVVLPLAWVQGIQLDLQDRDWSTYTDRFDATGLPLGLKVGYRENHFTFHYTAAPSRYPDKVIYEYKLVGFDEEWRHSAAQFATYSNLPHGQYTFEVRARIGNGEPGPVDAFSFVIKTPFWLTWWFILLEVLFAAAIVWFVLYWRKRILTTRHEKEKFELRSRLLALEQQSLNSSMNRHFIFNALNSIQYYINRQDKLAANKYLSDFAKLIRKNLDSSQENLTSLREEIERLELYLKLEHMRFKDKFEYHINIEEGVDTETTLVPAMLLQPFLENSIWHGLLPKGGDGKVSIDIFRKNGSIHFIISDNGIGIENSLKRKNETDQHISKGMEITSGRIDLIKKMTDKHVELLGPYQMHDEKGLPEGTRVEIIIPADFQQHFS
ncbi:MAG: histidine kinase [Flavobacteriales bacterium]|nr:histidine kinase [Flavobacteriales bacterium]